MNLDSIYALSMVAIVIIAAIIIIALDNGGPE